MEALKNKIMTDGQVLPGDILKVDSFLNHQLDVELFRLMGEEFKRRFEGEGITKILTVEASGIAVAIIAAQYFEVPVVFAKKHSAKNLDPELYEASVYSYTKGTEYKIRVSKKYLDKTDKVLILDDFLASGRAVLGLYSITKQAGASLAGVGIVIEKGFQDGGEILRDMGLRVESLATIRSLSGGQALLD